MLADVTRTLITTPEHDRNELASGQLTDDEVRRMAAARAWSKSPRTLICYAGDWRAFSAYCRLRGRPAYPATPDAIEAFITFLADIHPDAQEVEAWQKACEVPIRGRRMSRRAAPPYPPTSVERQMAGMRYIHSLLAHKNNDNRDPFADLGVRETLRGIRRRTAAAKGRPKEARPLHHEAKAGIDRDLLLELVGTIDTSTLPGLRDRAILCVGYVGAMRISEVARLSWGEIKDTKDGYAVKLGHSKANQDGRRDDDVVLLPKLVNAACPVRALQAWRSGAGLAKRGFVFSRLSDKKDSAGNPAGHVARTEAGAGTGITPQTVANTISRILKAAKGIAPPQSKLHDLELADFAGHSLRRGMATAIAETGGSVDAIKATLRHSSVQTSMGYVQTRDPRRINTIRGAIETQE